MNQAAVSYIERADGRVLCVWNKKYGGWSFPGGKVEAGESVRQAQVRELREETSLETLSAYLVFEGDWEVRRPAIKTTTRVHIFIVTVDGEPYAREPGAPVAWLDRKELLQRSPFAGFYEKFFAHLDGLEKKADT